MKEGHLRLILFCSLLGGAFWFLPASAEWHQVAWNGMGTRISMELWVEDAKKVEGLVAGVRQQFDSLELLMSRHLPEAELYTLNLAAPSRSVKVTPLLFEVIQKALAFSELSQGAFDITVAAVGRDYDFRNKVQPDEALIRAHLPGVGYQHILLFPSQMEIRFTHPETSIDLGGIGKGFALDQVAEWLRQKGVRNAVITAGGDTRFLGDRRGRPWVVGVQDPRDRTRMALSIPLENEAISTSGDYERYFIGEGGERVHHILSPLTGRPTAGLQSVSVIGPVATSTDALSTTLFVMGVVKGLALINRTPGYEAIMIDQHHKVHYSEGLSEPVQPEK